MVFGSLVQYLWALIALLSNFEYERVGVRNRFSNLKQNLKRISYVVVLNSVAIWAINQCSTVFGSLVQYLEALIAILSNFEYERVSVRNRFSNLKQILKRISYVVVLNSVAIWAINQCSTVFGSLVQYLEALIAILSNFEFWKVWLRKRSWGLKQKLKRRLTPLSNFEYEIIFVKELSKDWLEPIFYVIVRNLILFSPKTILNI